MVTIFSWISKRYLKVRCSGRDQLVGHQVLFNTCLFIGCTRPQLQHVGSPIFAVAGGIFSCGMWIYFPDEETNLGPLHWERGVLATGPPGKSLELPAKHFLASRAARCSSRAGQGHKIELRFMSQYTKHYPLNTHIELFYQQEKKNLLCSAIAIWR